MLHASMSEGAENVYNLCKATTDHDIVDCCKATEDKNLCFVILLALQSPAGPDELL